MKKKIYIAPQVIAYNLNLTEIICNSDIVEVPVGGKLDGLDAAPSRGSDWDEYMRR